MMISFRMTIVDAFDVKRVQTGNRGKGFLTDDVDQQTRTFRFPFILLQAKLSSVSIEGAYRKVQKGTQGDRLTDDSKKGQVGD